jgi:hypothetical protein
MTLGSFARKLLGDRIFPILGNRYRSFFVDLATVSATVTMMAPGPDLLDVGGGMVRF